MSRYPQITDQPMWARVYAETFGRRIDWEAAEIIFDRELSDWDKSFMADVCSWMASQGQRKKWPEKPTAKLIAIAYKCKKHEDAQNRSGYAIDTPEGFSRFVKGKLDAAVDELERWNICCSPEVYCGAPRRATLEEIEAFVAYCQQVYPAFCRPDMTGWARSYLLAHPESTTARQIVEASA